MSVKLYFKLSTQLYCDLKIPVISIVTITDTAISPLICCLYSTEGTVQFHFENNENKDANTTL